MSIKPRVVFFGTPWIAKECLETIHNLDVDLVGVVAQPDRETNRKGEIVYSEVKQYCLDKNIPIIQPVKLSEGYEDLEKFKADIFITCAYGQFISDKILALPKYGCVNIHASLLPKLRGGAPIHWAIINGDNKTGITFMYTIKKMDAGNIIFKEEIPITNQDTYKSMLIKLAQLAKAMINKYFFKLLDPNLESIEQDEANVTIGLNIKKEQEFINFNNTCRLVDCQIRGLYDKPMAKFEMDNVVYKVHQAKPSSIKSTKEPGVISNVNKEGIFVATTDYDICLTMIQAPCKKAMMVNDIINGSHNFKPNIKINANLDSIIVKK